MMVVFVLRGQQVQRGIGFRLANESDTVTTVKLVGRELAPNVVTRMVANYEREYPKLHVLVGDGGSVRALEAIANRQAGVGLLYRPPTAAEQELIKQAVGDTVVYYPIALGGIAALANASWPVDSLALEDLRGILRNDSVDGVERLYAPDPNQGLWGAFLAGLGFDEDAVGQARVTFLKDETEVLRAVAADPASLGIASTFTLPDTLAVLGVKTLRVLPDTGSVAFEPGYEQIGYGEYPLYHYLYAACLSSGSIRAAMFVSHLTSDRGQRQVERAGVLPARQTMRQIYLTRKPVGS
jgi:ABC-type phosphate transport system substrate-binding protein